MKKSYAIPAVVSMRPLPGSPFATDSESHMIGNALWSTDSTTFLPAKISRMVRNNPIKRIHVLLLMIFRMVFSFYRQLNIKLTKQYSRFLQRVGVVLAAFTSQIRSLQTAKI